MSEAVVDALEMVDIEDRQAQGPVWFCLRPLYRAIEFLHEGTPVGQRGEGIGHGEVLQFAASQTLAFERPSNIDGGDDRQCEQQQADYREQVLVAFVGDRALLCRCGALRQLRAFAGLQGVQRTHDRLDCIAIAAAAHELQRIGLPALARARDHRVHYKSEVSEVRADSLHPQDLLGIVSQ